MGNDIIEEVWQKGEFQFLLNGELKRIHRKTKELY